MHGMSPLEYLSLPDFERVLVSRALERAEEIRVERERAHIKGVGISVGNHVGRVMGRIMAKIFG